MGLFDTIYVNRDVASVFDLRCEDCGEAPTSDCQWQTKSLSPCMFSYVLRHDAAGVIRLYLLDRPSDRRFWRAWTDEEIAESEAEASKGGPFSQLFMKQRGEGRFLADAFLPENRRQRFMGELPHQWVEIYATCACGSSIERWMKFSDGMAIECRGTPPRHEPGFFEDAGDFGLGS